MLEQPIVTFHFPVVCAVCFLQFSRVFCGASHSVCSAALDWRFARVRSLRPSAVVYGYFVFMWYSVHFVECQDGFLLQVLFLLCL